MRMLALGLALSTATVAPAAAQEKPDFTGTWVLASPAGAPANAPATIVVRESFKRESTFGAPLPASVISMHIERRSASDAVTSEDVPIGIIGGVISGTPDAAVAVAKRVSSTWDGDRLVLETVWSGRPIDGGTSSLHRETWSLDRADVLTVTTKESIGQGDFTTTTVTYRR
jgi:hypothetical protein